MHFISNFSLRLVLAAGAALTGAGAAAADAVETRDGDDADIVVVIGQRVSKSLLETTASVSILDEEALQRDAGRSLNEAMQATANLVARSVSEAPNIRGVEGGGPGGLAQTGLSGTQPRVPVIVDEVARPSSIPNVDFNSLWDVERVEVFKGSQSTLRGRSAIGGAIVVRTNDPVFEPEAAVQGYAAIDDFHGASYGVNAMASGGVVEDRLALRATAEYAAGDDPRTIVGPLPGQEAKVDALTEYEQIRLRAKALFLPTGEQGPWRVSALAEYQEGVTPQTRGTVFGPDFDDREIPFTGGLRLFDTEALVGALDVTYTLPGGGVLRSITSHAGSRFGSRDEQPIIPAPQNFFFDFDEAIFNQDLIYELAPDGALSGLIGLSYMNRTQDVTIVNRVPPVPDGSLRSAAEGDQDMIAAFADLRYALNGRVDLLFGGRWLQEDQTRTTYAGLLALPSPPFPISLPPVTQTYEADDVLFLPSLGVQFDLGGARTLALTAREGWNSGGAAVQLATGLPFTFDPERAWTYEATYRWASSDGRRSFGATAFFSDYEDAQFFLQTIPGSLASTLVVNLPGAQTYGLELEATAEIAASLSLSGSLGLLETEITEPIATRPGLEGNRFGKDPEMTVRAGFVWTPPAAPGLSVDGQARYIGEFYNDFNNIESDRIGGYTILDLGASYDFGPAAARLAVTNLTDETGVNALVSGYGEVTPPRTLRVSVTRRF